MALVILDLFLRGLRMEIRLCLVQMTTISYYFPIFLIKSHDACVFFILQQVTQGNKKSCRASHHIGHERFEMLDGLLPLVLLPFSIDLFGLF